MINELVPMKRRDFLTFGVLGILASVGGAGFLKIYKQSADVREIHTFPDPILRKISTPVGTIDDKIISLSRQMIATLKYRSMITAFQKALLGRGLSAPQVGISKRLMVCGLYGEMKVLINPEIVEKRSAYSGYENCLSLPDHNSKKINRPGFIKVKYRGLDNREHVQTAAKGYAALLVHEIDHLNGILYTDYGKIL